MRRGSQGYQGFRDQRPAVRMLVRLLGFLAILFIAYTVFTRLIVQSVQQQSSAMTPTLEPGDRTLIVPFLYGPRLPLFQLNLPGFSEPHRGDLVLARPSFLPDTQFRTRLAEPVVRFSTLQQSSLDATVGGQSTQQIKRIVGLPGDTIRMERFTAFVRPAGESEFQNEFTLAREPYQISDVPRPGVWDDNDPFGASAPEVELGENEYFLLSDNRSEGLDSRHWGPVAREALLGRITFRYWPFARFGSF